MIGSAEIYKVVTSMLPLYTAIVLGYGSIRWWQMFKPDQCDVINRFNCYFIMPFFTFQFISKVNPYQMNFRFIGADVIAKLMIGVVLVLWANFSKKGNFSWSITTFSLSSLNNTLLIGVPLLQAMYGDQGADLVVQSSVIQSLLWFICLLFMLELRRARRTVAEDIEMGENGNGIGSGGGISTATPAVVATVTANSADNDSPQAAAAAGCKPPTFWVIMHIVGVKLAKNPNSYACMVGLIWALIAKRWNFEMPIVIEGCILIMSKGGAGLAMFSMGLFMALQEKVISCGMRITLYAMVLRFVIGPVTTAAGAFITGLRGDVLRIVIVQAALPQALTAFVYAQEYGLHAQVLSTAVIIGTVISLPLLIGYYAALDLLRGV